MVLDGRQRNETNHEESHLHSVGGRGRLEAYSARKPGGSARPMAIEFGLILLWFRSQGGYKPVEITEHGHDTPKLKGA